MDSFDKKVSDIFNSDSHDEVPAEFSWSEMNQGIYKELDKKETKKRLVIWFWLGGISSLIILSFIISNLNPENAKQPKVKEIKLNNTALLETPKSSISTTKENKTIGSKMEVESIDQTVTNSKRISGKNLRQLNSDLETLTETKPNLSINKYTPSINTIASNQNLELTEAKTKESHNDGMHIPLSSNITGRIISTISENATNRPTAKINSLILVNPQHLDYRRNLITIESIGQEEKGKVDQDIKEEEEEEEEVNFPTIYTGTLLGFGLYDGADDRSKYSAWLPGYYVGIRVPFLNGEKYNLYTGYEHKFAVQKFEINATREILKPIKNALVHTTTNALTGQQIHTHKDTVGLSTVTHNYEYYNTFRSNTLNLGVQRSASLGPIKIELSIGASYSFLVLSKGKTIGNDFDIMTYSTEQPIYRKSNWGIEGGMDINISLSKKLKFNLHARGEQSINNWSIEDNISIMPSFVKIGGGLQYKF